MIWFHTKKCLKTWIINMGDNLICPNKCNNKIFQMKIFRNIKQNIKNKVESNLKRFFFKKIVPNNSKEYFAYFL